MGTATRRHGCAVLAGAARTVEETNSSTCAQASAQRAETPPSTEGDHAKASATRAPPPSAASQTVGGDAGSEIARHDESVALFGGEPAAGRAPRHGVSRRRSRARARAVFNVDVARRFRRREVACRGSPAPWVASGETASERRRPRRRAIGSGGGGGAWLARQPRSAGRSARRRQTAPRPRSPKAMRGIVPSTTTRSTTPPASSPRDGAIGHRRPMRSAVAAPREPSCTQRSASCAPRAGDATPAAATARPARRRPSPLAGH